MQRAVQFIDEQQRQQVEAAVTAAETQTSCEIVPVVASASGRYDRAEDVCGLWLAVIAAVAVWLLLPRETDDVGDWGDAPLYAGLLTMVFAVVVAFVLGAIAASRLSWLRRLFTPRQQMKDEVATRAREVFFDQRVHHTRRATGLLIYVSLYERLAVVLGDQTVLDQLGQPALDRLCQQLTEELHQGRSVEALCSVIAKAGDELAGPLPPAEDDANELHDALVLID